MDSPLEPIILPGKPIPEKKGMGDLITPLPLPIEEQLKQIEEEQKIKELKNKGINIFFEELSKQNKMNLKGYSIDYSPLQIQMGGGEGFQNNQPNITMEKNKNTMKKPNITIAIGLPAVGKSTYLKTKFPEDTFVISNDEVRTKVAERMSLTYNDTFLRPKDGEISDSKSTYGKIITIKDYQGQDIRVYEKVELANKIIREEFAAKIEESKNKKNVFVDLTNLTKSSRDDILLKITGIKDKEEREQKYNIAAVVFEVPTSQLANLLLIENLRRVIDNTKTIPTEAYIRMAESYQKATKEEFSSIKIIKLTNQDFEKRVFQMITEMIAGITKEEDFSDLLKQLKTANDNYREELPKIEVLENKLNINNKLKEVAEGFNNTIKEFNDMKIGNINNHELNNKKIKMMEWEYKYV